MFSNIKLFLTLLYVLQISTVYSFSINHSINIINEAKYYDNEIRKVYEDYLNLEYESGAIGEKIDSLEIAPDFSSYESTVSMLCAKAMQLIEEAEEQNISTNIIDSLSISVARVVAFRSLMLSEANKFGNQHLIESAVENYFKAFDFIGKDKVPIYYRPLPRSITIKSKNYSYLADIFENRASEVLQYSPVKIIFEDGIKNLSLRFPEIELKRQNSTNDSLPFFNAKNKFALNYKDALSNYIAIILPPGEYYFEVKSSLNKTKFCSFTVRASEKLILRVTNLNNEIVVIQDSFVPPIPQSKIDEIENIERINEQEAQKIIDEAKTIASISYSVQRDSLYIKKTQIDEPELLSILGVCLSRGLISLASDFTLKIPASSVKNKLINLIASKTLENITNGKLYKEWNFWRSAWDIVKSILTVLNVPTRLIVELVELVYCFLTNYVLA